jgi:hypothetical protein
MDEPAAAVTQQHHQVLEVCIGYVVDTSTLVRVCLASREQQSQVIAHVQQQLPTLVVDAVATGRAATSQGRHDVGMKQMQWLRNTAGPAAVGAAAVADALLRLGPWQGAWSELPKQAVLSGLQLSTQQLVSASKERAKGLEAWIDEANRHAAKSSCSSSTDILHIIELSYKTVSEMKHRST